MVTQFLLGNLMGRVHFGDPGVNRKIILKLTFKNIS